MQYLTLRIRPLTYVPLAFRTVAPLDFPQSAVRCSACRQQIQGQASRDEHQVPFHAECLLTRKEVACAHP